MTAAARQDRTARPIDRPRLERARAGLAAIIDARPAAAAALLPIFDRLDEAYEADGALDRRLDKVRALARAERV